MSAPDQIDAAIVTIDYTNYKGERRKRRIMPMDIEFRVTPHHTTPQWILHAWDIEKDARRSYAMKDIHSWEPAP